MIYSFKYAGPFRLCELRCTAYANSMLMYIISNLRDIAEKRTVEVNPHVGKYCQSLGRCSRQNKAGQAMRGCLAKATIFISARDKKTILPSYKRAANTPAAIFVAKMPPPTLHRIMALKG